MTRVEYWKLGEVKLTITVPEEVAGDFIHRLLVEGGRTTWSETNGVVAVTSKDSDLWVFTPDN